MTDALPFVPLVAEAVHQVAPLVVFATFTVQSSFVEKEMDCSPCTLENDKPFVIRLASMVISDLGTSGVGVGPMGSSPSSLQAMKLVHIRIANKAIPINLSVFII